MNRSFNTSEDKVQNSFYVHLVESPSPEDFRANRLETKAVAAQLELLNIPYSLHYVVNSEEFRRALMEDIVEGMKRHQLPPLVHLSTHGSIDGIQLTDQRSNGECLSWNDVGDIFRPLHKAINGGLGVCMSCCGGIHGKKMAEVLNSDQIPFSWLIGTTTEADIRDLALGFSVFYRAMQRGQSADQILDAMRIASNITGFGLEHGAIAQQLYANHLGDTMNKIIADLQKGQGLVSTPSTAHSPSILGQSSPLLGTPRPSA